MQKNLTEDKVYKPNMAKNSMLNRLPKDDLIGRIRKGIDDEGNKRDLFWPKVSELRVLGLRLPFMLSYQNLLGIRIIQNLPEK